MVKSENTHHSKIDALVILERVQKSHQPFALSGSQNITLGEDVSNFIQLEQELLAHDLQSADLPCVFLLRKINLPISSLANLCENLEVTLPQSSSSLAEIGSLTAKILGKSIIVFGFWGGRWNWVLCLELRQTVLPGMHIGEKIVVVIKEVCICVSRFSNVRPENLT